MKEILEKLKSDFEYHTGGKFVGLVKALAAGFASRIWEFNGKLKFLMKQAFITTADSDYLFLHSGRLLPPKPSEVAEGFVVFFGQDGATVDEGETVSLGSVSYTTISEAKIEKRRFNGVALVEDGIATIPPIGEVTSCDCVVNGIAKKGISTSDGFTFEASGISHGENVNVDVYVSALVDVRCNVAGAMGNLPFGEVLKMKKTAVGIDKECGVISIQGGLDDEDVEDYRARVLHDMANPRAPFNDNDIKKQVRDNVPTLKYVWVKGGDDEASKVKVFALNSNGGLTATELERVRDTLQDIKPAQMKAENITSGLPVLKLKTVVIADLLPAHDEMKDEVRKSIEYLFEQDLFEKGVAQSEIESVVYRTSYRGREVESFTVSEGSCAGEPYTVWVLDDVQFT